MTLTYEGNYELEITGHQLGDGGTIYKGVAAHVRLIRRHEVVGKSPEQVRAALINWIRDHGRPAPSDAPPQSKST